VYFFSAHHIFVNVFSSRSFSRCSLHPFAFFYEQFQNVFKSTKLEAAAEAMILAERKRRKRKPKKVAPSSATPSPRVAPASIINPFSSVTTTAAADGSDSIISADVATARLLPLLESIWADLPKKPLPGARQGSSVLAVEATSAWAILRNDSLVKN